MIVSVHQPSSHKNEDVWVLQQLLRRNIVFVRRHAWCVCPHLFHILHLSGQKQNFSWKMYFNNLGWAGITFQSPPHSTLRSFTNSIALLLFYVPEQISVKMHINQKMCLCWKNLLKGALGKRKKTQPPRSSPPETLWVVLYHKRSIQRFCLSDWL